MNTRANAFRLLVEEQLQGLSDLRLRRMFGGFGLYAGEIFFGILHGEALYFWTSESTRSRYEAAGTKPFITPGRKIALKRYYQVPLAIIERRKELLRWAREAIAAARAEARE